MKNGWKKRWFAWAIAGVMAVPAVSVEAEEGVLPKLAEFSFDD